MRYDAYLLVESIKSKHWLEMLQALDAALAERRHASSVADDDRKFFDFIVATRRYLLSEGRSRPEGIDNSMLLLLKPLCESLVAEGRFARDCLDLFADLDVWQAPSWPWAGHASRAAEQRRKPKN